MSGGPPTTDLGDGRDADRPSWRTRVVLADIDHDFVAAESFDDALCAYVGLRARFVELEDAARAELLRARQRAHEDWWLGLGCGGAVGASLTPVPYVGAALFLVIAALALAVRIVRNVRYAQAHGGAP